MIFILFGLLIALYSFRDYHKSINIYIVYKLLLVTNITLISIPGIPILSLEVFLDLFFYVMYYVKKRKKERKNFPLKTPFILLFISYLISAVFSVVGFTSSISSVVKEIIDNVLFIYIIWANVRTLEDFKFIFKGISIVIFGSCIYGLFEQLTQSNPYIEYTATLNRDSSKVVNLIYYSDERGWRTQSIFEHCIGAGIVWGLYITTYVLLKIKYNYKFKYEIFYLLTVILCIICIYFTRSRTPLFFTIISLISTLGYCTLKRLSYSLSIISLIIIFAIYVLSGTNFSDSFSSTYAGGSSLSMRLDQFDAAFSLFSMSPIYGLGEKFTLVMSNSYIDRLLGSESIWILVLTKYGILGLIANFAYLIYMVIIIPFKYKKIEISIISLAYWIAYSVSTIPGFKIYVLFLLMFFIIKEPVLSYSYKKSSKNYNLLFIKQH